ncbi:protein mono-ADP-ribosyltransferase PARP10 [Hyla sarda]|uniref:protein mono-ADP-ribosyltransferase PARP10 n=1 Tax=Hyla sarda TaxID=327740 RepID=UPI0024C3D660|nr:protein mono-ADP-ribosyltransferase PARP10 [Hyla sarda]
MELEVQDLTDDIDTEFLILYLESKRRSGGGPISFYSRNGSQALVTFENPSDAENVLSKEKHCVGSLPIRVRRPLPWDSGRVALCGLHPDTEESLLEIYVENVSGRAEFLLVRSSDRRNALVTFCQPLSDEEFDHLVKSIERRPVPMHGSSLTVQRVRLCPDVLVENIGCGITADLLEMYFESRRSGGGRVNSVRMLRNNSAAVVSFTDVSVAMRVLSQSHLLHNSQLTVSSYYPALVGSPSSEVIGPPEENHSEDPGGQKTGAEEALRDPVVAEQCEDWGPAIGNTCDVVTPPPMGSAQDIETSLGLVQEHEVLMDLSELRFMQEYQHELLAGMDQVTIVPLEGQDKCGFRVSGDAVSCKTAVELLLHIVSSLSSRTVTFQYAGVSLFLLEDEGQRMVLETEQQYQCIIDTSRLSWRAVGCKPADPWSFVPIPDTDSSSVQFFMAEDLSEAAAQHPADIEDIKVFASLLKNSQSEEDKEEHPATTIESHIKQDEELDLYTDASAKGPDEGPSGDEELEQACKMSKDEYKDLQLDEEAQLLLAIQMSMDSQDTRDEDQDLQKALELSLRDQVLEEAEEPLQMALEMSLRSPWAFDEISPRLEDSDVSRDEMGKALDTAHIKVLAGDETSLVVACAALRKAMTARLCSVTLDGVEGFQDKAEILSALERKHKVTIAESDGQTQIHGFLQNPLKCKEELSQILSAVHTGWRSQAGLIPVSETSEEYNRVLEPFLSTLHNLRPVTQVLQVQKVQNTLLYKQYQLKKQSMLGQYPGMSIERTLYHGTTENGAKEICHRGFNRSFCGKNATLYGHGVYFAVESTISARDIYSPPSSEGNKYILVAQVLTGEFTAGKEDMKTPPIKTDTVGDVPQRYDSLADHLQDPAIFVIFNDTQAYPQYLITCCKKRDCDK